MIIFVPVDDGTRCCAFLNTVTGCFIGAACAQTFSSLEEINDLPPEIAERCRSLVPEGYFERPSTYFDETTTAVDALEQVATAYQRNQTSAGCAKIALAALEMLEPTGNYKQELEKARRDLGG